MGSQLAHTRSTGVHSHTGEAYAFDSDICNRVLQGAASWSAASSSPCMPRISLEREHLCCSHVLTSKASDSVLGNFYLLKLVKFNFVNVSLHFPKGSPGWEDSLVVTPTLVHNILDPPLCQHLSTLDLLTQDHESWQFCALLPFSYPAFSCLATMPSHYLITKTISRVEDVALIVGYLLSKP